MSQTTSELDASIEPDAPKPSRKAEAKLRRLRLSPSELRELQERNRLRILLAIAVFFAVLASYWLYQPLVVETQKNQLFSLAQQNIDSRRELLTAYINKQRASINDLTKIEELQDALLAAEVINTQQASPNFLHPWQKAIPGVLHLALFPQQTQTLDRNATFPIRYAELDLINRTQAGEKVLPEFNRVNNQWIINWSIPIVSETPSGTQIIGSLLAVLDGGEFLRLFRQGDENLGHWVLEQQFSDQQSMLITQLGEAGDYKPHSAKIPHTYLQIHITPSESLAQMAKTIPSLWLTLTAIISLSLLAIVIVVQRTLCAYDQKYNPIKPTKSAVANPAKEAPSSGSLESLKQPSPNPLPLQQSILDTSDEEPSDFVLSEAIQPHSAHQTPDLAREIFRSYDIRGLVETQLTPKVMQLIGRALGSVALEAGETHLLVARDGRTHSESLCAALIEGVTATGCHVIDMGLAPTPMLYFATFHHPDTNSGLMLTASHNPKAYNGIKAVIQNRALSDEGILSLIPRIESSNFRQGQGEVISANMRNDYIERIASDVVLASHLHIVIDAGNAVPGLIAPELFRELGCEVTELYCDLDGEFPHHDPDPTVPSNLLALIEKVAETGADLGVAFDGDGDRVVLVTRQGEIIWPDRLMMIFARDLLQRHPGADVLFDVKCSRQLQQVIQNYGGRPIMWKTGHSPMKAKMEETQALLGGEYSGHIFIKDRWYGFDDGLYAAARLLEIMTLRDQSLEELFEAFPKLIATPELKITLAEQAKFALIDKLIEQGNFDQGKITSIDGLRVDYPQGWGLVRASNTSPALTLRFEAESDECLDQIKHCFKRELLKADNSLSLPF